MNVQQLAQCHGKQQYLTWHAAEEAATRTARHWEGQRFEPYVCRYCERFHVGHGSVRRPRLISK